MERRALDAFIKLTRAADSIHGRLGARAGLEGLTEGQFGVLEALLHLGPLCPTELSRKLLRSGGNLTVVIDNLERRALVRRVRGGADRRFVSVELTGDGEATIRRILPGHVAAIVGELSALSAAEMDELGRLCRRIGLPETERHRVDAGNRPRRTRSKETAGARRPGTTTTDRPDRRRTS